MFMGRTSSVRSRARPAFVAPRRARPVLLDPPFWQVVGMIRPCRGEQGHGTFQPGDNLVRAVGCLGIRERLTFILSPCEIVRPRSPLSLAGRGQLIDYAPNRFDVAEYVRAARLVPRFLFVFVQAGPQECDQVVGHDASSPPDWAFAL